MKCRVCEKHGINLIFRSEARSIVSITCPVDIALNVYACENCGHAQSDDINYDKFYSQEYRFQLSSEEHDQLHAVVNGKNIYRTDLQAQIVLENVSLPLNAKVIDYGAAKARTLQIVCGERKDLVPYVFDVSDDYTELWSAWLPPERQSKYIICADWKGLFDVAFHFFVLEHVADPNAIVAEISSLLVSDGILVLFVPNPIENYSDFVVLEHVSHFTRTSLVSILQRNNLEVELYSTAAFFGAHVVIARKRGIVEQSLSPSDVDAVRLQLNDVATFWNSALVRLQSVARDNPERSCAIYGAGVYGSYLATRLEKILNLKCFVDRNPHVWGVSEFGVPILPPGELPMDVDLVFSGVNPLKARAIMSDIPEWRGRSVEIVFLDEDRQ